MRTIVDIHVLQTVPPSNVNRDDTGSPKTATYGGSRRARVSSQAWKRATRDAFDTLLDPRELGVRTKRVVELLRDEITRIAPELADQAVELATLTLKAADIKVTAPRKKEALDEAEFLVFLSRRQIENLAVLAVESTQAAGDGAVKVDRSAAKARSDRDHSVDIAMFGRMVASATDLNVEAAVQVAHALSVHAVSNEYDYFTAVDDHKRADDEEDAGAGMIGTVEFNSSTLYRYANIDVDQLQGNLGDAAATRRAVEAFTKAFITSMPTGKQNTFANRTLPDAVLIVVRETQPINLVGAYENAVGDGETGGRITASVARLAKHAVELHEAFDENPVAAWAVGGGERIDLLGDIAERASLTAAISSLSDLVSERLAP
ncbi:type I-E CRISPR-associated protein Cas7/Cse4/CasC [Actinokineospora globicatena]|uniref:Type I-E CRISPR-associated protein Cas7/Cse4/CasC n=1 Tax=Actinokineospora globicatena TaxID=103729 RepID=A0A9W6V892_9PSEU|nr:type I-E CRISPR-associated protein Cas7/Cse4/CasC [Actinokineospora globicatena]GLW89751.1 type I-E CRISPR-associated protein Cas7/Cse4/CasC [Actinokineospora globicatena]